MIADLPSICDTTTDSRDGMRFLHDMQNTLKVKGPSSLLHVEVLMSADFVRLRGKVNSYYQKQLAQETIKRIIGQRMLRNELIVLSA